MYHKNHVTAFYSSRQKLLHKFYLRFIHYTLTISTSIKMLGQNHEYIGLDSLVNETLLQWNSSFIKAFLFIRLRKNTFASIF